MDTNNQSELLFVLVATMIISMGLLYIVIRSAVSKETKETVAELKKLNRLRYLDLKKQGVTDEEIRTELSKDQKGR